MRPLDGVTVLDLTRLLPGPAATRLLEAYGADVICVRAPGDTDDLVPRGRRVALDLKSPRDHDSFLHLADSADVLIEGFRPGVMRRLALDFETLHARNPRLIYVSLTGYGQTGSNFGVAGHDINYLATAGFFDLNGSPPAVPGVQIADLAGGSMQTVIGVLLALAAREKTGRGQHVDVSMTAGVAWMIHQCPESVRPRLTGRYPCYRLYRTSDHRWLSVGALEPKFWSALCEKLARPDLVVRQFDETANGELESMFRSRSAHDWMAVFEGSDACVALVRTLAEAAGDAPATIPVLSETPVC